MSNRPLPTTLVLRMGKESFGQLKAEASLRDMRASALASRIVSTVLRDSLVVAVLDDGPVPPMKRNAA